MSVVHRVTGYDKRSEFIAQEFDVPTERVGEMRDIAGIPPDIGEIVGAYPLDRDAAQTVKDRFHFGMWVDSCDWFFEPFAV